MDIEYLQLDECDRCPYRDTEIIDEKFYANNEPYYVSTVLRCKNYFACERMKNIMNSPPIR